MVKVPFRGLSPKGRPEALGQTLGHGHDVAVGYPRALQSRHELPDGNLVVYRVLEEVERPGEVIQGLVDAPLQLGEEVLLGGEVELPELRQPPSDVVGVGFERRVASPTGGVARGRGGGDGEILVDGVSCDPDPSGNRAIRKSLLVQMPDQRPIFHLQDHVSPPGMGGSRDCLNSATLSA